MNVLELLSDIRNFIGKIEQWFSWVFCHPWFRWVSGAVSGFSTYFGLYFIVEKIFSFFDQLQLPIQSLDNAVGGANGNLLSRVNYFFPLDTVATAVLLYSSIWTTCLVVKFWMKAFRIGSDVVEKVPFIQ